MIDLGCPNLCGIRMDQFFTDVVVSSFSASQIRKNSKLNPMRPAGVLDGFRLI